MSEPGFEILYEEGPCLVVNKPGGVLTQAPPGIDSLERRVKQFLKTRDGKPGNVYLGVAHRLDRPVSGAIVLAKHARAARRLCEQFQSRSVEKTYWALVEGQVGDETAVWTDTLRKIPDQARGEVVAADDPDARTAVLRYRVLQRMAHETWLEIRLETGRMHQIRIQASSRGHPVLGDELYGSTRGFGPPASDARQRWIALHARSLSFVHPMTRAPISVTAPLSAYWEETGLVEPAAATLACRGGNLQPPTAKR